MAIFGQKVVLRILDKSTWISSLWFLFEVNAWGFDRKAGHYEHNHKENFSHFLNLDMFVFFDFDNDY